MSDKQDSTATEHFNKLIQFRQAAYANLGTAKDALFELGDAVINTPAANSFAELSCSKHFRRRWSSAYEALQDGRPDRQAARGSQEGGRGAREGDGEVKWCLA